MDLPTLPTSLKSILPYLQRAIEFESKSPLISFYLRSYAAQQGVDLITKGQIQADPQAKSYIMSLFDKLDQDKSQLAPKDEDGRGIVESFSLKLFQRADDSEREGKLDLSISKQFYAAHLLMNSLEQFGDVKEEIKEKSKYAKYKAAEIAKKLKDGPQQQELPPPPEYIEEQQLSKPNFTVPNSSNISNRQQGIDNSNSANNNPSSLSVGTKGISSATGGGGGGVVVGSSFLSTLASKQTPTTPVSTMIIDSQQKQQIATFQSSSCKNNGIAMVHEKDVEDIMQAQKLAKHAISALQFPDVPKAVEYLQNALDHLKKLKQ